MTEEWWPQDSGSGRKAHCHRKYNGGVEASDLLSSAVEVGSHVRGPNGSADTDGGLGHWAVHTEPLLGERPDRTPTEHLQCCTSHLAPVLRARSCAEDAMTCDRQKPLETLTRGRGQQEIRNLMR